MSPIDAGCLTVALLGSVFAFAAGLSIALEGDAAKRMGQAGAADSSGVAWVLILLLGFLEQFPKTDRLPRGLFLVGSSAAVLSAFVWLAIG